MKLRTLLSEQSAPTNYVVKVSPPTHNGADMPLRFAESVHPVRLSFGYQTMKAGDVGIHRV